VRYSLRCHLMAAKLAAFECRVYEWRACLDEAPQGRRDVPFDIDLMCGLWQRHLLHTNVMKCECNKM